MNLDNADSEADSSTATLLTLDASLKKILIMVSYFLFSWDNNLITQLIGAGCSLKREDG